MNGKREYGDYQTPDSFALRVCKFLKEKGFKEEDMIATGLVGKSNSR